MIGSQPTVGGIVLLSQSNSSSAIERVFSALETVMPVRCESRSANKWAIKAVVGASEIEGILFALEENHQVAVFLEFDEGTCVQIASRSRQSLESLFLLYVNALEQMPGATAVGIGFEMAVPTGFEPDSLEDAGIAVWFEKSDRGAGWQRRDVYHLTGHAEPPFVRV